ncbi:hypothetical protein COU57_06130 [Candidatus Pacearchaeota archaeon CG10_big_fil_rev_8_21_14_0_10_32_14]|nr:MAG: hypothetical protein COU57_06130 [Candidatus Pacearchaeota archaeon CG10_big_fil_rev_8_21_14_0_10_32_14]
MKNEKLSIKNIKIKDLKLWDENPRFPEEYFKKPEKDLIGYLFKKENSRMIDLAKSISENFNLIPLERLVVWKSGNGLIVLEGNRRIAIYKILSNLFLLPDKKNINFFNEKSKQLAINENFEVECIVVDDREEGLKYVDLKHLEKGYSNWQESERINFQKRRGISMGEKELVKHDINRIVKGLDLPEKIIDKILGQGNLTTFYRIIASTPAKKYFGYEIKENNLIIEDKDFESKLKIIIWQIINKKDFKNNVINSRSLNTIEDIEKYLKNIDLKRDYSKLNEDLKNSVKSKIDVFGKKTEEFVLPIEDNFKKSKKSPILTIEDKLFGKTLCLKKGKVNNLYCAMDKIYEQNKYNEKNLELVLPILGISLRLILDVAAREYYSEEELKKDNTPYRTFLKEIKQKFRDDAKYKNLSTLTLSWVISDTNFENIIDHYAHDSIIYTQNDILKISKIIGEILECFFKI